jgi:hypothetical protein
MRIAKPILLVTTPIGVAGALWEAYRLAGGLVFLLAALIGMMSFALGMVVLTIRRQRAERDRERAAGTVAPPRDSE